MFKYFYSKSNFEVKFSIKFTGNTRPTSTTLGRGSKEILNIFLGLKQLF